MQIQSRFRSLLVTTSLLLSAAVVHGDDTPSVALPGYQPGTGITKESVEDIMNWALKTYKTPGASIAVIKDGEILIAEGFGIRNTESGKPVNDDTLFQLASVSKTFTASAFGAAVDQDTLEWEQPASKVLPNFEMHTPYATEWVNGKDFLVHRSGFPGFFGDLFDHLGYSRADIRHRLRFVEPGYSFRDHPEYSNIGFFLAGEMVAQAGGNSFESVLEETILTPLQMKETGKAETLLEQDPDNFAAAHIWKDDAFAVVPHNLSKVFVSAGGLASNATDLANYVQMLVTDGSFEGKTVVSKKALETIFEPVITSEVGFSEFPPIDENSGFDYSPGWGVYHYNGVKVLEKGGALDGVRTLLVLVPQEKFGIAILSNMNLTALPEAVRAGLLQQMFGETGEEDLQPEIRHRADQIDEMLFGSDDTPKDVDLTAAQIKAFVGQYNNDLYGLWEIALDPKDPSKLIMHCGPAEYTPDVTFLGKNKLGVKFPIVLSAIEEVDFTIEGDQEATSFTFDGYEFRRQGNAE
ncbi:serine hydrolase domain-containing protein [Puniceicoccus vermicola]|uniref:Beta-lactamase family protein n=1 Tax=Puniceicoccus vermicola TaxID=388746 RepID=A0A7X1B0K9_9BACT|nr:serine hydrolase domain-containing protein [Puniceicoccus vermicola]MBC2603342.1 beta-lactamase family protein [Puniceicoccus vermicola]